MDPRPTKKRLSMACNNCRLRKVKCDADYPRCRNCRVRDEICATCDPRRPGEPVVREWIVTEKIQELDTTKHAVYASPTPSLQRQLFPQGNAPGTQTDQSIAASGHNDRCPFARDNEPGHTPLHESPVHQPFHVSSNTDPELNRTKIVGGSSSQCLAKSLDVYLKSVHRKPISDMFKYGMRYAEEFDIPLEVSLPPLPVSSRLRAYISTFFDRIHPLYPLFDVEHFQGVVNQLVEWKEELKSMLRDQIPWLAIIYLGISMGADEQSRSITADGTRYLHAAATLLSHVTFVPYLPAVQALLMYTIAYRGRNQEGLGWQTLGMAIRIAHTIGIHRRAAYSAPRSSDMHLIPKYIHEGRIWAVCCILEKCMELESGRPTSIPYSFACDDILPPHLHEHDDGQLLRWQLGLAVYQHEISQHIYGHTLRKRRAREILLDTARLDKCLLDWVNSIPPQTRPGNDIFCPKGVLHLAALLSMMYHEAMITLHRAALIAPNANFEAEVEKEGPDDSSRFRILGGESICINSARAIAKLSIELSDQKTDTRLIPIGVPLLACIVLAIYQIKHPDSRMQSTDLPLLKTCLEICSEKWIECGQDSRFIQGLSTIYERVSGYINSQRASKIPNAPQNRTTTGHILSDPSHYTKKSRVASIQNTHFTDLSQQSSGSNSANHIPYSDSRRHDTDEGNAAHTVAQPTYEHIPNDAPILSQYDHTKETVNSQHGHLPPSVQGYDWLQESSLQGDSQFPFDGYNVEDLWEWMLYFDSQPEGVSDTCT
ncbi:conserved hypothetical protein [Talaromyces stipitatus ATCC 10500]|uniref:Zn(2)-C6 fungal-type domain-containing protein n=1 Tax=Talaromyces stipitatus (strain ATCC 10500 / CBS 375.48 / QM 6759 / NRRL 1006) TaxID=441959 RepID=B8MMC4_TALSN|nr:uncharacterized protein TSTA_099300 [Talaromyces stipitatus ATCC 10500]EED13678.1 conserved hypothetical protein [Talaromyces stipitatus ATCC 10500]